MVFIAISKEAHTYGKGLLVSKYRYEIFDGVKIFFMMKNQSMKSLTRSDCLKSQWLTRITPSI
jgi:hypothetical protein